MTEEKEKKKYSSNKEIINLKEFMLLDNKNQDEQIKETLEKMYEGDLTITSKHIEKVLNIAFDNKDNEVYLPKSLCVQKEGSKLIFAFRKKNNLGLFILFLLAFLFVGGFATYSGVQYLGKAQMNRDLDGDGVADINIDLDNDGICDVNCDTNKDDKPERNIDFQGNRKPTFNVLLEDGSIFNPTNQDLEGDGICDINCDTDGDGWPDLNIDIDGDGKVDLNRDIDGDGIKDLDIDINGDGVCDINCDEDKDGVCDKNCTNVNVKNNGNGSSTVVGDGGVDYSAVDLIVMFDHTQNVVANNIYPDDQPGDVNTKVPDLTFSVENTTDAVLYYDINWSDIYNTFESDNFMFRVQSDNNGLNQAWRATPKSDGNLATRIAIAPRTKQSYRISFTLHGTGDEQNYDQGKTFKGKVKVDLIEER